MRILISFKHLDHTPALDQRIREKTLKLEKYLEGNTNISWTCYVEDGHHYAEVKVNGPKFQYYAKANSDNLYKTIDLAIGKVDKQLRKQKEKWKDRIHHKHNESYKPSSGLENSYGEGYVQSIFKKSA